MKTLLISFFALGFTLTASAQTTTTTPAPSDVKQVKTTPTLQANTPISPANKQTGATTGTSNTKQTPRVSSGKRVNEQPANNSTPVSTAPQGNRTKNTETLQQASPAPTMAAPKN